MRLAAALMFGSLVPQIMFAWQAAGSMKLDVVVNNKSGSPVTGLQREDFTLLDNKQPEQILSFEAVGQTLAAEGATEVMLILDAVNTSFTRVAYERDQVKRFLQQDNGKLSRPVSLGILTDAGLDMQGASSLDGNALAAYLDSRETGLRLLHRSQGFYGAVDREQLSIRVLEQLAQREESKPGRKLVIWISPGWPMLSGPNVILSPKDEQNIFGTIIDVSSLLRRSGITLYSVDPLGTSDAGGLRTVYYEQFLEPVKRPKDVYLGDVALQVFATQSGGRVLTGSNDVAAEIERCVRDATAYYVLSYNPPQPDGPNEYHAIQVKVNKPDLKAQTRAGYYAAPEPGGR